jgi:hypothetical protein
MKKWANKLNRTFYRKKSKWLLRKAYHPWPWRKCKSKPCYDDSISLLFKWLSSRTQTRTNAGKDVGKKEPSYTAGCNVNEYNHYGKQYGGSKN